MKHIVCTLLFLVISSCVGIGDRMDTLKKENEILSYKIKAIENENEIYKRKMATYRRDIHRLEKEIIQIQNQNNYINQNANKKEFDSLLLQLLPLQVPEEDMIDEISLLTETRKYYTEDETPSGIGTKTWFGIFRKDSTLFVEETRFQIEDTLVHYCGIKEKREKLVFEKEAPLFLVAGLKNTKQGVLTPLSISGPERLFTVTSDVPNELSHISPGEAYFIKKGDNYATEGVHLFSYGLVPFPQNSPWPFLLQRNYHLAVSGRKGIIPDSMQVLIALDYLFNMHGVKIVWIGDLDDDNKPDMLIEVLSNHPMHVFAVTKYLFLSSYAGENEFMKMAAKHTVFIDDC